LFHQKNRDRRAFAIRFSDELQAKLSIGKNQLAFELNGTLLVSKLIEGNYNYPNQRIAGVCTER
jgi:DNA polymerase III sliding clamp (beta) subunit (PCNA family)